MGGFGQLTNEKIVDIEHCNFRSIDSQFIVFAYSDYIDTLGHSTLKSVSAQEKIKELQIACISEIKVVLIYFKVNEILKNNWILLILCRCLGASLGEGLETLDFLDHLQQSI